MWRTCLFGGDFSSSVCSYSVFSLARLQLSRLAGPPPRGFRRRDRNTGRCAATLIGFPSFSHIHFSFSLPFPLSRPGQVGPLRPARLDDNTTTFNDLMTTSDAAFHEHEQHTYRELARTCLLLMREGRYMACASAQHSMGETSCVCFGWGGRCTVQCKSLSGICTYFFSAACSCFCCRGLGEFGLLG